MNPTPDVETRTSSSASGSLVGRIARWGMGIVLLGAAINLAIAWQSIRTSATRTLDNVDPQWLAVAAVVGLGPWLFIALRMWMWARFLDCPITLRQALRTTVGTELASSISPKAIGGSPAKVAILIDSGVRPGLAASILMLDNIADVIFFAVVAPAIAYFSARWQVPEVRDVLTRVQEKMAAAAPWIGALLALVVLLVWLRRRRTPRTGDASGKLRRTFARAREDFLSAYALVGRHGKTRALAAVGLTTGLWLCRCSVGTAVLFGLGHSADPVLFFLLQWVVFAMMVFVPTPGAALGAEASFAAVLDGFVAEGILGVATAGWRFFAFYLPLLVGLVLMPVFGRRPQRTDTAPR